jgi:hypothetical protein
VRLTQVYAGRKVDYIDPVELAAFAMTGWVGGGGRDRDCSGTGALGLSIPIPEQIRCKRFLISSDGSRHKHPHVESIARTVRHSGGHFEFVCNYQSAETSAWNLAALKQHYDYEMVFPAGGAPGIARVAL